jgi:hypothetical protein
VAFEPEIVKGLRTIWVEQAVVDKPLANAAPARRSATSSCALPPPRNCCKIADARLVARFNQIEG